MASLGQHHLQDADSRERRATPMFGESSSIGEHPSDVPPMTFSLLGRFFAVPLLIISVIVGGAILVVLLFGGPAAPDQRTLADLLQSLETSGGERNMGLLLPREKEVWQTALELSVRLENKHNDAELKDADLAAIAARLGDMLRADLAHFDDLAAAGADRDTQREYRSERLRFLILALGRTERIEAVAPLLEVLNRGDETYAPSAVQALGYLHEIDAPRAVIAGIVQALQRAQRQETKLLGCTVLSVLADAADAEVVDALRSAYRTAEGEVEWNCALALARLGDSTATATLLDLMDRGFLERDGLYEITDAAGVVHRYSLPPQRVDGVLVAAVEAGAHLDRPDVWTKIGALSSDDPSPAVRERAAALLRKREYSRAVPRATAKG